MPTCPICQSQLQKPPEDIKDWFRCETCGTPLQVPPAIGKTFLAVSIGFFLALYYALAFFARNYPHVSELFFYAVFGFITVIYTFLARLFWKTRLIRPSSHDPYSSLNLSDSRKKMRGHN